jgi:hypothetical protein
MTTDLDETRLQVFFLPINVYVEDTIIVCIKTHLIKGLIIHKYSSEKHRYEETCNKFRLIRL